MPRSEDPINPYQSPLADSGPAPRRGEDWKAVRWILGFISTMVFVTAHESAVVDVMRLHGDITAPAFAPFGCLVAWLVVFATPIPDRWQPIALRTLRRLPALARHGLLWLGLAATAVLVHHIARP